MKEAVSQTDVNIYKLVFLIFSKDATLEIIKRTLQRYVQTSQVYAITYAANGKKSGVFSTDDFLTNFINDAKQNIIEDEIIIWISEFRLPSISGLINVNNESSIIEYIPGDLIGLKKSEPTFSKVILTNNGEVIKHLSETSKYFDFDESFKSVLIDEPKKYNFRKVIYLMYYT